MDMTRKIIAEVVALLRLLGEWERRELALLMLEQQEAGQDELAWRTG